MLSPSFLVKCLFFYHFLRFSSPKGAPDSAIMVFTIFLPPLCRRMLNCSMVLSQFALSHPLDHHSKGSYLPAPCFCWASLELLPAKLLPMLPLFLCSSLCHFIVSPSQISRLPLILSPILPPRSELPWGQNLSSSLYAEKTFSQPQGRSTVLLPTEVLSSLG